MSFHSLQLWTADSLKEDARLFRGPRLLSQHNLWFYGELTRRARQAIHEGRYASFRAEAEARMRAGDEVGRASASAEAP